MKARAMATRRRIPPERLAGKEVEGLLQLDKAQGIADAEVDFVVGNALLNQLVGDVVADGERIEERALLEDHAGAGAQGKELLLGHVGDLFAEEQDAALIGAQQAVGELEQDALAHAGRAEQDAGLSGRDGEADGNLVVAAVLCLLRRSLRIAGTCRCRCPGRR